ncbi:MAG: nodulation protein NfeD [Chloroflexi bacterium]|nr:nodulation protein NfeD [Chloroflexota bacterium]
MSQRMHQWTFERPRAPALGLMLALGLWLLVGCQGQVAAPESRPIVWAEVDGPITATTRDYLTRVLNTARRHHAQVAIVRLNTPGGTLDATEIIIQRMRASPVPVVVYVTPEGAMAGSAGALIVLAGHRAYMAPATVIGAATPIGVSGQDLDPTLKAKTTNILAALARALAEPRGLQAQAAAARMVTEAHALTAAEALEVGLIDGILPDEAALLRELDGQTIATQHATVTLRTERAPQITVKPLLVERVLALLTNPNLVLLLLSVGVQLILIELSSPGGWFAGFLGSLFLILAIYGLGFLPVNWTGLLLLGLAFVLFVLEVKKAAHGLMALAGAGTFVFGALLLFNTPLALPGQRLTWWWALAVGLVMAGLTGAAMRLVWRAREVPVLTGAQATARLVGRTGWARTDIQPGLRGGTVYLQGELWSARLARGARPIRAGEPVRVVAVQGMYLIVRPVDERGKFEVRG